MLDTQARPGALVGADTHDGVRVLTLTNPPVNALSFKTSTALLREIDAAEADPAIGAVVITGSNGFFSGGADINDFQKAPEPGGKSVRDVVAAIETQRQDLHCGNRRQRPRRRPRSRPGLRLSHRDAGDEKSAYPRSFSGSFPGPAAPSAYPRLLATKNPMNFGGIQMALQMMLEGKPKDAKPAKGMGIIDEIVEGDVVARAVALGKEKAGTKNRISALKIKIPPPMVALAHGMVPPEDRGGFAAAQADRRDSKPRRDLDYPPRHRSRSAHLPRTDHGPALAVRGCTCSSPNANSAKIPGLATDLKPKTIEKAAVIGAGTMGTGIAMVFANAGIPVSVIDVNPEQAERGPQERRRYLREPSQKGPHE